MRYLVNFGVVFVLIPVIIEAVGESRYGLWALVFSIVGYAGLLDLGVQQATVKLVSQYRGAQEPQKLNAVASSGLAFFMGLAALTAAACWFVVPEYMHLFVSEPANLPEAKSLLRIIGMGMFFFFGSNVVTGIALGMQQYHYKGIFDSIFGLLRLGLTFLVLHLGYGLLGLAWIKISIDAATMLVMGWACHRGFPDLRLRPGLVSRESMKELFRFGSRLFTASTVVRLNRSTNPVIIAYFLGAAYAAYFAVAVRLVSYANEILMSLTSVFLPIFSELGAAKGRERVREIYLTYSRYMVALTVPAYLTLLLAGPTFVGLWIDGEFARQSGAALQLMAATALVRGLQPLMSRVIIGWGDVGYYTNVVVVFMLLTLGASVALVPLVGIAGPPLAGLATTIVQQGIFLAYLSRKLEYSRLRYALSGPGRVLPPALAFAGLLYWLIPDGGQVGYGGLVAAFAIAGAAYFATAFFSVLTGEERRQLLGALPFVGARGLAPVSETTLSHPTERT
jgi:O-antigen/teichoic acid export membrane protein